MVVGRLLSYWGPVTFQGQTVKLLGGTQTIDTDQPTQPIVCCQSCSQQRTHRPSPSGRCCQYCRWCRRALHLSNETKRSFQRDLPRTAWNSIDLYFWRSTPQNKAFSNQNKGHFFPGSLPSQKTNILLMAEILHQLIGSISPLFTGFFYIPGGAGFQPSTVGQGCIILPTQTLQ